MAGSMSSLYETLSRAVSTCRVHSCCCFAPLRSGILLLGYFNIAMSIVLIVGVASETFVPVVSLVQNSIAEESSPTSGVLPPAAELAFSVLLVAAMHRDDEVLLRVYLWYGAANIAVTLTLYAVLIALVQALYVFLIILSVLYQAYVMVLVRSVIVDIKLSRSRDSRWLHYDTRRERLTAGDCAPPPAPHIAIQVDPPPGTAADTSTLTRDASLQIDTAPAVVPTPPTNVTVQTSTLKKDVPHVTSHSTVSDVLTASVSVPPTVAEVSSTQKLSNARKDFLTRKPVASTATSVKDGTGKVIPAADVAATSSSAPAGDSKAGDTRPELPSEAAPGHQTPASPGDSKADPPTKKKRGIFRRAPKETKKPDA